MDMRWVLVAALGVACAGAARGAAEPPRAAHVAVAPEAVAALEKAANVLWPAPRTLSIARVKVYERYSDGVRYETWSVKDGAQTVGELVRLQVFRDPRTVIDVALRVADGKIAAAAPVFPTVLAGTPFPGTAALFAALAGRPVADYAGGMSDVFQGLAHLDAGAAGPHTVPSVAPGTPPALKAVQPALAVGAALPSFSATTIGGKPVSARSFAGKPLVVLVADVTNGRSRDMLDVAARELARHPKARMLPVLANDRAAVAQLPRTENEMELWLTQSVLDADRKVSRALMVAVVPQVFLFDHRSKLVARTFFTGPEDLRKAVTELVAAAGR